MPLPPLPSRVSSHVSIAARDGSTRSHSNPPVVNLREKRDNQKIRTARRREEENRKKNEGANDTSLSAVSLVEASFSTMPSFEAYFTKKEITRKKSEKKKREEQKKNRRPIRCSPVQRCFCRKRWLRPVHPHLLLYSAEKRQAE